MQKSNLENKINFCIKILARALGFEPRSKVLETRMLPLHHARVYLKELQTKSQKNTFDF
jgi:hypothetical protein